MLHCTALCNPARCHAVWALLCCTVLHYACLLWVLRCPVLQSVEVVSVPLDTGDRCYGYAVLRFESRLQASRHHDK